MTLKQCTDDKAFFNKLVNVEQSLTVSGIIKKSPLLVTQGLKPDVVAELKRVIYFFLEVTGKELENYQISVLAGDLYDKFKTDSLEDVVIMLKMARQGEFGKIYTFDTFTIMSWCDKYLEYKSATREKLIQQRKKKVEPEVQNGKYFHELPQELQDKFNSIGRNKTDFHLPRKAKDLMTTEKLHRDLNKKFEKQAEKKKNKK